MADPRAIRLRLRACSLLVPLAAERPLLDHVCSARGVFELTDAFAGLFLADTGARLGSMWVATPPLRRTFTVYSLLVSRRTNP